MLFFVGCVVRKVVIPGLGLGIQLLNQQNGYRILRLTLDAKASVRMTALAAFVEVGKNL